MGGDERQGIKNSKYYFSKKFGGKEGGGGITRLKECFLRMRETKWEEPVEEIEATRPHGLKIRLSQNKNIFLK